MLGFIWGSGYSLAKYAMTHAVPPLGYAFWQSAGPAFLLLLCCLWKKEGTLWRPRYWGFYAICGAIGIAIPNTNMYFIASKIPAGILAVLVNTVPLMVYPLARMANLERKDGFRLVAIALGIVGLLLIINPSIQLGWSGWALLALLSPLSFALCAIYIAAKQPSAVSPLVAACGMLISATCFIIPLVWQQDSFYVFHWPLTLSDHVVLLEILLSTAGYLVFFKLIHIAGPVFYSLTGTIVALTGIFWGKMIFKETLQSHEYVGIFLVFAALFILTLRQSKQHANQE